MRWLVEEVYPDAEVIRVVLDNLNSHTPASLRAAFLAPEARRLVRKLEFHHTPGHGSWLNVAECELAVLASQCLDRRLPGLTTVAREVAACEARRKLKPGERRGLWLPSSDGSRPTIQKEQRARACRRDAFDVPSEVSNVRSMVGYTGHRQVTSAALAGDSKKPAMRA
jgi:hypothetical protein